MAFRIDERIVQLHLTDQCNLRCSYCYEDRAQRSSKRMKPETARAIAARHLDDESAYKSVQFDFIGGEPLFVWDLIVSMVEFVHSRKWRREANFTFTTNGTLFTDEMKAWLDRHTCVSFSFSIDGTRAAHNLNRCGSYDRMIQHVPWALDRCTRMGMEKRVKMTIGPDTVPMIADGIAELHAMGFEKVDANVPHENIWGGRLEPSLAEYARQLDALISYYLERPHLARPRLIDLPFEKLFAQDKEKVFPRWCGSGDPMICYDEEGRPLPCHRFVPVSTGLHYEGPLSFPEKNWEEARRLEPSPCVDCPFVSACPSCMALNWLENGDVDRRTHWHCGFILLQIKASAKFTILRNSRQIAAALDTEEGRAQVSDLKAGLDQALAVHEMLSGQAA